VLADWGAQVVKIEPPTAIHCAGLAATGLVPYQPDVNPRSSSTTAASAA
jgi:crotonobetainyl-CoA:carnitine CoA-transferase CaiB-like acyl-CoA transferase